MGIDLGTRAGPGGQLGGHCNNGGKRALVQTKLGALGVMSGEELCLYDESRLSVFAHGLGVGCERKRGSGKALRGLPWWFSGQDSALPRQGAWVQSLIGELDPICHS